MDISAIGLVTWLVWFACTATNQSVIPESNIPTSAEEPVETSIILEPTQAPEASVPAEANELTDSYQHANVTEVSVSGSPGSYRFLVTIESPDTGCEQYADWWEVLSGGGELIYRRVLLHSHVNEQPFTRSGGPVDLLSDDEVIVRAHMNTSGYGGSVMRGNPADGFMIDQLASDFAKEVEAQEPLPTDCDF